jgi:hypothetical protein
MKFLRSLLGLTRLDHQTNTRIREKVKVEHVVDEIQSYQRNRLQDVKRMEHSRVPRMALAYQPKGKCNIGLSKKKRETNSTFKIEVSQHRTQVSVSVYVHDDDGGGDDDDDDEYLLYFCSTLFTVLVLL